MRIKKFKVLFALLFISMLLVSCTSIEEDYNNINGGISFIENSQDNISYEYLDDFVEVKVVPLGNKIHLAFTNNTPYRILLHIEKAKVLENESINKSAIITLEQSKVYRNTYKVFGVVVNPGETFEEEYVAVEALTYDPFDNKKFEIINWAVVDDLKLELAYGIFSHEGEELYPIIIE